MDQWKCPNNAGCKPGDKELCLSCLLEFNGPNYVRWELETQEHDHIVRDYLQDKLEQMEKRRADQTEQPPPAGRDS